MWNVGVSQMQHINPKTVQLMNNLFSLLDITFPVHSANFNCKEGSSGYWLCLWL